MELTWLGCIAHFINLIVNDSIKEVPAAKALIKLLGKFVRKIRKSGRLTRLLDELQLGEDPTSETGYFLKTAIHRNLMERFFSNQRTGNKKQNYLQNNKALNIALLMDPRLKDRCLVDKFAWRRSARTMVLNELEAVIKAFNEKKQLDEEAVLTNFEAERKEVQSEEIECDWMSVLVPKHTQHITFKRDELDAELSAYLASNIVPMSTSVMSWWEGPGRYSYPSLYYLAKKYCIVMSTSVPAERLFSNAGKILNNLRQRLDPGKVHDIAFIQGNLEDKEEEFKDFLKAEYKKDWKAAYAWYLEEGTLPNFVRRTL